MSNTIAKGPGFVIVSDPDTNVTTVSVRAEKLPVPGGYGHTFETGTTTRADARMFARQYVTPAPLAGRIDVSAAVDTFRVGTELWRTYMVRGA